MPANRSMIRTVVMLTGCLPIMTQTALAQDNKMAQIAALPIAEMCSKDGALGQKFGATSVPPSTQFSRGSADNALDARFAPFDQFGFSTSKYSNKMYEAVMDAKFGDEAQAAKAIQNIAALFISSGWTPVIGRDADDTNQAEEESYLIPPAGAIDLYLNAADSKTGEGVRASLQPVGDGITLTCKDSAFFAQHIDEVTGGYPLELGRPKAPISKAVSTPIVPIDCSDQIQSSALISSFKNSDWLPEPSVTEEENYQESLAAWKNSILVASGKISRDDLARRQVDQIVDTGTVQALNANMDAFTALMPKIEALEKIEKSGDRVALCRGMVSMKSELAEFAKKASANNKSPWASFHKFLDTEAERLGVVFPL